MSDPEECPICKKKGEPKCPTYKGCRYRLADLCSLGICWRSPESCRAYLEEYKKKTGEKPEEFSPSSRNFR